MFSDILVPVRITDTIAEGIKEIEFNSRMDRLMAIVILGAKLSISKQFIQMTC
jgi:hypothetical protein